MLLPVNFDKPKFLKSDYIIFGLLLAFRFFSYSDHSNHLQVVVQTLLTASVFNTVFKFFAQNKVGAQNSNPSLMSGVLVISSANCLMLELVLEKVLQNIYFTKAVLCKSL